jgi:hypothetical protein
VDRLASLEDDARDIGCRRNLPGDRALDGGRLEAALGSGGHCAEAKHSGDGAEQQSEWQ